MPFLTPFSFRAPAANVDFYTLPVRTRYQYVNVGGGSSSQLEFVGHVEIYETGTVRFNGYVKNTNALAITPDFEVWVGSSRTVGTRTSIYDNVPADSTFYAVDFTIRPGAGESVMLMSGDSSPNTGGEFYPIDCFDFGNSGWKSTIDVIVPWDGVPINPTVEEGYVTLSLYWSGTNFKNDYNYVAKGDSSTVGVAQDWSSFDFSDSDPRNWALTVFNSTYINQVSSKTGNQTVALPASATDGYWTYANVARSGINITRAQFAIGPFPRTVYAPTLESGPEPEAS